MNDVVSFLPSIVVTRSSLNQSQVDRKSQKRKRYTRHRAFQDDFPVRIPLLLL